MWWGEEEEDFDWEARDEEEMLTLCGWKGHDSWWSNSNASYTTAKEKQH